VPRAGLVWIADTLTPTMALFVLKANVAIREGADRLAEEMEQYAQQNAPWEDQTGDARAGLTAKAEHHGFRQEVYLFHTVDYGIWLEVRWNGKYAIINPTIEHFSGLGMGVFFGDNIMMSGARG
jgi:hypothetical protein